MSQTNINTDDCWLWAGHYYGSGHGSLYLGYDKARGRNITMPAYRAVYESEVGEIAEGLEIDHLCEVPQCVNPDHLEPVTHQENTLRYYRRRTHCRKGHPYEDNVYWKRKRSNVSTPNPTGLTRMCKTCCKLS